MQPTLARPRQGTTPQRVHARLRRARGRQRRCRRLSARRTPSRSRNGRARCGCLRQSRAPRSIWRNSSSIPGLPHIMMRSVAMIQRRQADIVEQLLRGDQVGDAAAVAERLAGHGRIIDELLGQERPEQFVVAQLRHQFLAIGEFGDLPAAVHQHDGVKPLIDVRDP